MKEISKKKQSDEGKIHWHPGFCGASEIELIKNKADLEFNQEYSLNKEPLRADMLIIKKKTDVEIENEIGRIFKKHNILEYKSPGDGMSIDDYFKTVGYACIYKGLGKTVNEIPVEELTISLLQETYPRDMLEALKKMGARVEEHFPGIYYVEGVVPFKTQIVVTGQLNKEQHSSLRLLSRNVQRDDVEQFFKLSSEFKTPEDRNNANAVLNVSSAANMEFFKKMKEDKKMTDVLQWLMEDVIAEREMRGEEKGEKKGAERTLIALYRDGVINYQTLVSRMKMPEGEVKKKLEEMAE